MTRLAVSTSPKVHGGVGGQFRDSRVVIVLTPGKIEGRFVGPPLRRTSLREEWRLPVRGAVPFGTTWSGCPTKEVFANLDSIVGEFEFDDHLNKFEELAGTFVRNDLNFAGFDYISVWQVQTPGSKERDGLACEQRSRSGVVDQGGHPKSEPSAFRIQSCMSVCFERVGVLFHCTSAPALLSVNRLSTDERQHTLLCLYLRVCSLGLGFGV